MPGEDRTWRRRVLAGTAPTLVLGFVASALANRLIFLLFGLVAVAVYVAVLRRTWGATEPWIRAAPQLMLAFVAFVFGALVLAHHQALDLGFRALLPGLYHSAWTSPATWTAFAAALALLAVLPILRGRRGGAPAQDRPA